MRVALLVLLGCAAACFDTSASAAPIPARPIVTNKPRFRIPYRFDAEELQRIGAREIRLFVSTDRGINWRHVQTVSPDAGRFEFQAPADGEYWFAVRTIDTQNQLHPSGNAIEAGLTVVVDTAPPQLSLTLQQVSPGRVQLAWTASDDNLDATKLLLEYMQPGSAGQWQQVSVVPRSIGQTAWSVPQGGAVAVRGSISDTAGNVGYAQSQVQVGAASQAVPSPNAPDFRQPIAAQDRPGPLGFGTTENIPAQTASANPTATQIPGTGNSPWSTAAEPIIAQPAILPSRDRMISNSVASQPEITRDRYEGLTEAAPKRWADGRYRAVSSRKFQIGYKLEDVGPSGVGGVELYITQDHGSKWWKYGEDADRQSPFDVEVPNDGTYGFALRVRSGAGFVAEAPAAGEQPPIIVVVDQTAPTVELMPVQQGQGSSINQLLIRWKISDENPSDKPVSLYYASNLNGPWEPISEWRPDSSSFLWTVGPGVPSRLYIRMIARDAAGNTSRADTPQPVIVDLSRPTARIVDIETTVAPGPQ